MTIGTIKVKFPRLLPGSSEWHGQEIDFSEYSWCKSIRSAIWSVVGEQLHSQHEDICSVIWVMFV